MSGESRQETGGTHAMRLSSLTWDSLRRAVRRAGRDVQAGSAIMFGVLTPVLIGTLGFGMDVTQWYSAKQNLEKAVRSAALSAADATAASPDHHSAEIAVRSRIAKLLPEDSEAPEIRVNSPPKHGELAGDIRAVEVLADQPQASLFTSMLMGEAVVVRARSVAVSSQTGSQCVLALAESGRNAINVAADARAHLDCGIVANSRSDEAVTVEGVLNLGASLLVTSGSYKITGSGLLNMDARAHIGSVAVDDPYGPDRRNLQVPIEPAGCTRESLEITGQARLMPGRYCNGLILRSAVVHFDPGTYIIDGGSFEVSETSFLSGDGVTFVLTGHGDDYANLNIDATTEMSLAAPTFGSPLAGLLFYQDQAAPASSERPHTANQLHGTPNLQVSGVLYFPRQGLTFSGGDNGGVRCLQIVAASVKFTGNTAIGHNCEGRPGMASLATHVVRIAE